MDVDVARAAGLFADQTRADVVAALLDGRALTAGELARAAGVSAPTVSGHLHRLLDAGLLAVEAQGRHRYYRLVDERTARAFEALAALAPVRQVSSLRQPQVATALRAARTCYDHLAGNAAVQLADALVERDVLARHPGGYRVTEPGVGQLTAFGLNVPALHRPRRSFAHPCLDWSERRHHVAGALGAALLDRMLDLGWLSRQPGSRVVHIHQPGRKGLLQSFGCDLRQPANPPQQA